ncbi:MAG: hypothetical protein MMC33_000855 [Icmadophila ericetorum]|nr:hypothetical protein [Icmadophila ericetorum]
MAPVYKIAVIQLHPKPLAIEQNHAKACTFIRTAASLGAHLAVLPEYHLNNWVPEDEKWLSQCDQYATYLQNYQSLAKELQINIIPGTIVERHSDATTEEDKLINVAYFISSKGEILGKYQKKNLWHPERPHLTSSQHEEHEVFETEVGKVGMLICWDLAFPEAFRELIAKGAKIVVVPTFWTLSDCSEFGLKLNPRAEALFLQSSLVSRAFENTCAVVFCNAGGSPSAKPGRANPYAGLSGVAMPFVGMLGDETKDSGEEGMSLVDVNMEVLEEAEKQYKIREDIGRDDWHYLYRHSSNIEPDRVVEKGKL